MAKVLKGNREKTIDEIEVEAYVADGWTLIGKDGKPADYDRPMSYTELMEAFRREKARVKTLEEMLAKASEKTAKKAK